MTFDPTGLQVLLATDGGENDETLRRVERGSRIVTVVPQDTRVILQVSQRHARTHTHTHLCVYGCMYIYTNLRYVE